MKNLTTIAFAAILAMPALMVAQTPTPGKNDWNINQRKNAQQERIGQGVKSGQLTAGETARLERQERGRRPGQAEGRAEGAHAALRGRK